MRPEDVFPALRRHLLVDGFDLVLDTAASRGAWLVDARDGTRYLDMFTFFASSALGMNPPALTGDPAFLESLAEVAVNKPSNSDIYTTHLAAFVDTFARVLGDRALPHLFFVEGGALAVENALKVAFDWKSRRNEAAGRDARLGGRVLHLEQAFHGRSGYTLSLTNTDPDKTARFPAFDWPRIPAPVYEHDVPAALDAARAAFGTHAHDIACFVAEPIQGEGGDRHLHPTFLAGMQALCHEHDALLVLDEVQTGCGLTGTPWAYQQLGVEPDVVAFGKKLQVCGIMAGRRVDDVADNVFAVPGRINSTWGGNLTDMVRARRVLEVIEADGLIARARSLGQHLIAALAALDSPLLSDVRGRGLMCAISLPDAATRDAVVRRLFSDERVIMLGCGLRSIRFRPALTVTTAELDAAVDALGRVLKELTP